MRVAYLTAGAGGMYCGSCMRDNTLVAALRRRGRDVLLIPIFSPIRTDEEDVSESGVLYGGINIYLEQKFALFRHTPWLLDRLFNSNSLLRWATKKTGSASAEDLGALTVSILRGEQGAQRKELDKLLASLREWRPDIVHLPDILLVGLARRIKGAIGVPVVCTLTGEDIFLDKLLPRHLDECLRLIRERAADVDAFLGVTRYYMAESQKRFGIPAERLHYVPLGVRIDQEAGSGMMAFEAGSEAFTIGYFARICPEKGLHLLCEAFSRLRREKRECRLKIGGYLGESDRSYFEGIQHHMAREKLDDHIEYDGELDREGKMRLLRSLDVLSVPTIYREAKGLYVLEAMSQGVPVVQPRHGSFPELVEGTGGGILVEPDNPAALAAGIASLMDDEARRHELGRRGQRSVQERFTDEGMADAAWNVFASIAKVSA